MSRYSDLSFLALASLAAGLLSSCSTAERVPPPAPETFGPLVSISFPNGDPNYGDMALARVALTNGTTTPIVVRSVDLLGQLPDRRKWLGSRQGRLRYEAPRKRVLWRNWIDDETEAVFASGLLFPGETLSLDRYLRVRGPTQDVVVLYQPATWGVLLPSRDELRPKRAVVRDEYFREPTASLESRYRRDPPGSPERVILFTAAQQIPVTRRQFVLDIRWADEDMPESVLAELDDDAGQLSAWDGGPLWILRPAERGEIIALVKEGDDERFPGVDFDVFDLADWSQLQGGEMLVDVLGQEELEGVVPEDLLEFLRGVCEQGARLRVVARDLGAEEHDLVLEMR